MFLRTYLPACLLDEGQYNYTIDMEDIWSFIIKRDQFMLLLLLSVSEEEEERNGRRRKRMMVMVMVMKITTNYNY